MSRFHHVIVEVEVEERIEGGRERGRERGGKGGREGERERKDITQGSRWEDKIKAALLLHFLFNPILHLSVIYNASFPSLLSSACSQRHWKRKV